MQLLITAIIAVMATTAVAAPQTKANLPPTGRHGTGEGEGGESATTRSQVAAFRRLHVAGDDRAGCAIAAPILSVQSR